MSTSAATDYLSSRPVLRTRPSVTATPDRSPRTPLLSRSISSGFGSPGLYRSEQEDLIIWEVGSRHVSAGFSGEGRPRCTVWFNPDFGRRVGDYSRYLQNKAEYDSVPGKNDSWSLDYELYTNDMRTNDLGLVKDKLERAMRQIHLDYLQLDSKARKHCLVIPSLLPTTLMNVMLDVLFRHSNQLPSISILTTPVMACVGAGLRDAVIVDIGWQETVVTIVGEYKEVAQLRSVRAGKRIVKEMAETLELAGKSVSPVSFATVQEVTSRMAWCRSPDSGRDHGKVIEVPVSNSQTVSLSLEQLSEPIDRGLFRSEQDVHFFDEDEMCLPELIYRVLLRLSFDLRSSCCSRIVLTGGFSQFPGLKRRLLLELLNMIDSRGWDPVHNYGSAKARKRLHVARPTVEGSMNTVAEDVVSSDTMPSKTKVDAPADAIPASERPHDDIKDQISIKAERRNKIEPAKTTSLRIVNTTGAWAGASLVSQLRVKGAHEIERDDFLKHGLRELSSVVL